ncbi:MAG: restriction endonuclease Mrr [Gammaproteobacteria bacterium]|jgi:restriction endonuclease Mrr
MTTSGFSKEAIEDTSNIESSVVLLDRPTIAG